MTKPLLGEPIAGLPRERSCLGTFTLQAYRSQLALLNESLTLRTYAWRAARRGSEQGFELLGAGDQSADQPRAARVETQGAGGGSQTGEGGGGRLPKGLLRAGPKDGAIES